EQERFDEVRIEDRWVFARLEGGYVGVFCENGLTVGEHGQYAGRELICEAPENTWIAECGREEDWGHFEAFTNALRSSRVARQGPDLVYESPSAGTFVTGWDTVPTIDGELIALKD